MKKLFYILSAILLTTVLLISCGDGAGGSNDGGGNGGGGGGGVGLTITGIEAAQNGRYIAGSGAAIAEAGMPEFIAAISYSGSPPAVNNTTLTGGLITGGKAKLNVWKENGSSWVPYTGSGVVSLTLMVYDTSSLSGTPRKVYFPSVIFTNGVGTASF